MITSLLPLATLFLMQARMLLVLLVTWAHCRFMFSRASTNTPGPVHCQGEKAKPLFIPTSLQEVVECNESLLFSRLNNPSSLSRSS